MVGESYPFYIHAATSSTASQHPCRLFFAAAAVAAPFILLSNSAYAALNCTTQPTCEQLGYSKSIDANCDDYILCPFDKSYKKCINNTTISINNEACAGFPLLWCPANAECFSCTSGNPQYGGYVRYKIRGCNSGFMLTDDSRCVRTTCSHFYGKRPEDCGPTGAEGYMMGTKTDNNGCFECLWKECPEGSQTYAPKCATGEMEVVVGYNAGKECTKCETVQCPSGYATDVSLCGDNSKDWFLNPNVAEGPCSACEVCPDGYSTKTTECPEGQILTSYFSCNKCINPCPDGYSLDNLDVSSCGKYGSYGWKIDTITKTYGGKNYTCGKCVAKTCDDELFSDTYWGILPVDKESEFYNPNSLMSEAEAMKIIRSSSFRGAHKYEQVILGDSQYSRCYSIHDGCDFNSGNSHLKLCGKGYSVARCTDAQAAMIKTCP